MNRLAFLLLICLTFSQNTCAQEIDFFAENRESYDCAPAKENGKWGIKGSLDSKTWIVSPLYDTVLLAECFSYKVPVGPYSFLRDADYLYVLFKKEWITDRDGDGPISLIRNTPFDLAKMDGTMLPHQGYDGLEVMKIIEVLSTEQYEKIQGIKLYKNGKCGLLENTFLFTETPYSDLLYLSNLNGYIAMTPDKQVLLDKRKNVLAEAKYFDIGIDLNNYDEPLQQHYFDYNYHVLPYLVMTGHNGKKQLFSLDSRRAVTPELSSDAKFTLQWARYEEENYRQLYGFEYEDNGKKGAYQSGMKMGTPCKFKSVEFAGIYVELNYLLGDLENRIDFELYHLGDSAVFLTKCSYPVEYQYQTAQVKKDEQFIVYQNEKHSVPLDSIVAQAEGDYSDFTGFFQNGLFGATNGIATIPAVFAEPVTLGNRIFDSISNEWIYFTQSFKRNGEERYYNSRGEICISQGKYGVRRFENKRFGVVEYYQHDSQRFEIIIAPVYFQLKDLGGCYGVMNDQKKWGLISRKGDTLLPFDYEELSELPATSEGWRDGKLIVARTGKQYSLFNSLYGVIIPAAEQQFELFGLDRSFLIKVVKKIRKQEYFGFYSPKGIPVLPTLFSTNDSIFNLSYSGGVYSSEVDFTTYTICLPALHNSGQSYMTVDFIYFGKGYRINCETNLVEQYDLATQQLIEELDLLEFAKNQGYNLVLRDGKYIFSCDNPDKEGRLETVLENIDFRVIEDELRLLGRKDKTWYAYQSGGYCDEQLFLKTVIDSKLLRVTVR